MTLREISEALNGKAGGERRRTEIARSLAIEPKFLLLDEPFAGIDPITVSELKGIVQGLSTRGIGVLITDHNVRDTLQITHRSHIINLGEILVSGSREELLASELARKICRPEAVSESESGIEQPGTAREGKHVAITEALN